MKKSWPQQGLFEGIKAAVLVPAINQITLYVSLPLAEA